MLATQLQLQQHLNLKVARSQTVQHLYGLLMVKEQIVQTNLTQ